MECERVIKLPVIDFSNVKEESSKWECVKKQVMEALEEYGCFEAIFDNEIALHLQQSLFDALRQLFDLPLHNKVRNFSDSRLGYVGQLPHIPLYESLGIDDVLSPGKIEAFENLMWSQQGGNPTFSKCVRPISETMIELDKIVQKMVMERLGLEKYMDEYAELTKYHVRVQKYDGPDRTDEIKDGLSSHTDATAVTVLHQNDVKGLELATKDGHWFSIHPSPGSFVVMIGITLEAWTNGRLNAPYHRVMMTGDKARYSIGTFSSPKPGRIVTTPVEMVDEEHPLLFNPFDHAKYLQFYYSEAPRRSVTLKDYCGVSPTN